MSGNCKLCNPNACHCDCGYRCGGPGVCKLGVMECLEQDDGKHYVKDCHHDFGGQGRAIPDGGWTVTCRKCNMSEMHHDMRCGP